MEEKAALLLKMIHELAVELHPRRPLKRPVTLDSTLGRDLGLDSLARVELLARIERHFRVTIPERIFADAETPRDLLRAVLGASPSEARAAGMDSFAMKMSRRIEDIRVSKSRATPPAKVARDSSFCRLTRSCSASFCSVTSSRTSIAPSMPPRWSLPMTKVGMGELSRTLFSLRSTLLLDSAE
jgi:acyl carrier protein